MTLLSCVHFGLRHTSSFETRKMKNGRRRSGAEMAYFDRVIYNLAIIQTLKVQTYQGKVPNPQPLKNGYCDKKFKFYSLEVLGVVIIRPNVKNLFFHFLPFFSPGKMLQMNHMSGLGGGE